MSYRGGWSSSLCDLFRNPLRRDNCCALACCGLLLSDRNAHFMLETPHVVKGSQEQQQQGTTSSIHHRPDWKRRFGINLGLPLVFLLVVNILYRFLARDKSTQGYWQFAIFWTFFFLVMGLLWRAKYERIKVRQAVMRRLYQDKMGIGDNGTAAGLSSYQGTKHDLLVQSNIESYLHLHRHDIQAAHSTCSCFPSDFVMFQPSGEASDEEQQDQGSKEPKPDLCTCIFRFFSNCCCGLCCQSWLQCCGMCAIGQESREIERLLDKHMLQVDYITFQPFRDYYPKIMQLRINQVTSLKEHWKALSQLSLNLVKILCVTLLILAVVAILDLDPKFQLQNLLVVLATFLQAFLVLYFVHWHCHRFDLSVDALVKYFASGFCLCTFLAILYEMLVSSVLGMASQLIVLIGVSSRVGPTTTHEEVTTIAKNWVKDHAGIFGFFIFLNAFVVAAMVEELSKYFSYFMVETPDLMDPKELELSNTSQTTADSTNKTDDSGTKETAVTKIQGSSSMTSLQQSASLLSTLTSRGAGITVAMVAVAAGFACCENLLYIFVYSPPGVPNEIATLIARSMFPIHPLCAAIQSLGVVERDLLQNDRSQLGRIILPAVLLHGAFDFVLMLVPLLEGKGGNNDPTDPTSSTQNMDANNQVDQSDAIPLLISIGFVFVGVFYYTCLAGRQRKRLRDADSPSQPAKKSFV